MSPLLIYVIGTALALVLARPVLKIILTACKWLQSVTAITHEALAHSRERLRAWLRCQGAPQPFALVMYACLGLILVLLTVSDFKLLAKSIFVIWPWEEASGLLAGALVGVVAVLAYFWHVTQSKLARSVLLLMLLGVVSTQGVLAYIRTIEIEKTKTELSAPSAEASTPLVIGNEAQPEEQEVPATAAAPKRPDAGADSIERLLPWLPVFVAVVLSISEAFVFAKLTSGPGATSLTWIIFGPFLGLNAIAAKILGILSQSNFAGHLGNALLVILQLLESILEALIRLSVKILDLFKKIAKGLALLFAFLRPEAVYARRKKKRELNLQTFLEEIRCLTAREIERLLAIREVERVEQALFNPLENAIDKELTAAFTVAELEQFEKQITEIRRPTHLNGKGGDNVKQTATLN
jgi:hypothetical protein